MRSPTASIPPDFARNIYGTSQLPSQRGESRRLWPDDDRQVQVRVPLATKKRSFCGEGAGKKFLLRRIKTSLETALVNRCQQFSTQNSFVLSGRTAMSSGLGENKKRIEGETLHFLTSEISAISRPADDRLRIEKQGILRSEYLPKTFNSKTLGFRL